MLILASNSPRRRQLLGWLGLPFEVSAANIDETPIPGEPPDGYTRRLSQEKAAVVAVNYTSEDVILASDTTVALFDQGSNQGTILGKPADAVEAENMLRGLRGRTHQVFTAVSLVIPGKNTFTELCTTDVKMRAYSDTEMAAYINCGDPLDKAGAYAIQHAGFHPVEQVEGCFASVMGFPLCHVLRLLDQAGIIPTVNVPRFCQADLGYACQVFPRIYKPVVS
jgi:septum formation protein